MFSKIMNVCEWIMKYAYLNALIILGTLVGAVFLGGFPSMNAASKVSKLWVGNPDIIIWKTFWKYYRQDFWISQKYGYIAFLVILIAFSNTIYWSKIDISNLIILKYAWCFIFLVISMGCFLTLPVIIAERMKIREAINLFAFSISQPHLYIFLLIGFIVIYLATMTLSGIFLFFVGSLSVNWCLFNSHLLVKKIFKLQKKHTYNQDELITSMTSK